VAVQTRPHDAQDGDDAQDGEGTGESTRASRQSVTTLRGKLSQMIGPRLGKHPWPEKRSIKALSTLTTSTMATFFRPQLCCSLGTAHGSPAKLVNQLSVIDPYGKGRVLEAGSVASKTVILGLFTLSDG